MPQRSSEPQQTPKPKKQTSATPNVGKEHRLNERSVQRAVEVPALGQLTPSVIMRLQATHGNRFVQRLLGTREHKESNEPSNADGFGSAANTAALNIKPQLNATTIQRRVSIGTYNITIKPANEVNTGENAVDARPAFVPVGGDVDVASELMGGRAGRNRVNSVLQNLYQMAQGLQPPVTVYCSQGQMRSATLAGAYLILQGQDVDGAMQILTTAYNTSRQSGINTTQDLNTDRVRGWLQQFKTYVDNLESSVSSSSSEDDMDEDDNEGGSGGSRGRPIRETELSDVKYRNNPSPHGLGWGSTYVK